MKLINLLKELADAAAFEKHDVEVLVMVGDDPKPAYFEVAGRIVVIDDKVRKIAITTREQA